jgi:hypothetical protein
MKRTPCFTDKLRPDVKFQPQQEPRPACPERYQRCRETIGRLKPRKSVGKMPAALDPPGSKTGPLPPVHIHLSDFDRCGIAKARIRKVRPNFLRTINRYALFCSRRSGRRGNPLACSSRARKLKPKCHARSERKGRNLFHNFPQLDRRASTALIDVRRWPVRRSPATSDRSSASSPSAVSHLSHPASVPARPPVRVGDRDRGSLPLGTTMAKPLFEGTPFPSRPRRWDLPPPRASSAYNSSWVACIGTNRNSLMLKGGAFVRRNI